MKVSVILDSYNHEKFIGGAIESVLNQDYADFELIIVDDASSDNSAAIIREHEAKDSRIRSIIKTTNQGQLAAYNTGIEQCTGDIIFFLDSDDVYLPGYITSAVAVYEEHPECDFLFVAIRIFGEQEYEEHQEFPAPLTDIGYTAMLTFVHHDFVGATSSANSFRKKYVNRIFPLFDEQGWRIRADECLMYTTSLTMLRKFYMDKVLIGYRIHGSNAEGRKRLHRIEHKYHYTLLTSRYFGHVASSMSEYGYLHSRSKTEILLREAATGNKSNALLKRYGKAILADKNGKIFEKLFYGFGLKYFRRQFLDWILTFRFK